MRNINRTNNDYVASRQSQIAMVQKDEVEILQIKVFNCVCQTAVFSEDETCSNELHQKLVVVLCNLAQRYLFPVRDIEYLETLIGRNPSQTIRKECIKKFVVDFYDEEQIDALKILCKKFIAAMKTPRRIQQAFGVMGSVILEIAESQVDMGYEAKKSVICSSDSEFSDSIKY